MKSFLRHSVIPLALFALFVSVPVWATDPTGSNTEQSSGGGSGGTSSTFGAATPATGTAAGMSQGGNMVALTGTSNNLNVQCANCSGSGASGTDEGTFTAGTSVFAPGGGFFQTTATSNPLTTGQWGAWQMTASRAGFVNVRNAAGTEMGTSSNPFQVTGANGTFPASLAAAAGADGWDATEGATTDAAATAGGTGTVSAKLREVTSQLGTIVTNTAAAVPAGTNLIGKVGIDQTTPGTTNGVQVNAALPAGTNLIGKTGIDQTTPGTTNGVQVNAALPAGTNTIGNVGQVSPYPATAVPVTATATGTTSATTATLTNVTGHTTYICGFSIRANAAAAATNNATVTGTITGTLNFTQWTAPNASGLGVTEEVFSPCVPASAVSTSIAVVSGAPGTSGVVSVTAWGYSI